MPSDEMTSYRSGSLTVRAFLARPDGSGPSPGIVVIQEWWGLNDHIMDIARRLAHEGYVAVAPDLYARQGNKVTSDADEAGTLMAALRTEDGVADLDAGVVHLGSLGGVDRTRIGVIGFCLGGSFAVQMACRSRAIRASVAFYGQVPEASALANLGCPILYHYAGADQWITREEVQRLEAHLRGSGKPGEVVTYPGAPHAFFNDTRAANYRATEAADAWRRSLGFFRQHLTG